MAMQAGTPGPEVICSLFVREYYHVLHKTPEEVHKFYQDTSRIGRAGSDGVMEYLTTLPEINKNFMSMDFNKYLTEIETADAVLSLNDSALIVVTGSLTSVSDDVSRRFTQTFFLAPQESGGYFVLNDVLRFLSEKNQENGSNQKDDSAALSVADTTTAEVEERLTTGPVLPTGNGIITVEKNDTVEPRVKVTKEDVKKTPVAASPPPAQKDIPKKHPISASPPPAQTDAIKKTYASIVKDNKEGPPAVKPKIARPVSKPLTKVVDGSVKPLPASETTPASTSVTKSSTSHDEQGYSIFVKGLPSRSTEKMVGDEFKKFGAIKPGGIQVRNNKFDEFCFGFVEFESQQSMQAAIEASPIFIAEKEIIIQKKRTNTRVVNGVVTNAGGGGRFQYGNNFRGQGGGYVNNASYRGGDDQFNRRDDGGNHFNRRDDGGNHYNRRDDGSNYYDRRNDGGNYYDRRNDGGNHYNQRNDDENFNRRDDFRPRNEFSGPGRGPTQGNGYHKNGNGFYQPRQFQNENGRYVRVNNGPSKENPVAGVNNGPSKQTPVAGLSDGPSKQTAVAA